MNYFLRLASKNDAPTIWKILQAAIERRKKEGSNQWQDGYPNLEIIYSDIEKQVAFVLTDGNAIIGYCAILINDEPAYSSLDGKWISDGDFIVFHRLAIAEEYLYQGFAQILFQRIEDWAISKQIYSIKADTNFDNQPMLHLFNKLGYTYCGEVYFRNSPRKAFEKILK